MKLVAKTFYFNKTKEVSSAYFDIKNLIPMLENELLAKVFVKDNKLQVSLLGVAKKKLKCYYVDVSKLEAAAVKYIIKNNSGLLPPNFEDTEFDEVILKK